MVKLYNTDTYTLYKIIVASQNVESVLLRTKSICTQATVLFNYAN